jgi:hypothetical protein
MIYMLVIWNQLQVVLLDMQNCVMKDSCVICRLDGWGQQVGHCVVQQWTGRQAKDMTAKDMTASRRAIQSVPV